MPTRHQPGQSLTALVGYACLAGCGLWMAWACSCHRDAGSNRRTASRAATRSDVTAIAVAPSSTQSRGLDTVLSGGKPRVRVALVGDQGIGPRAKAVLDLIRSESADILVILGDFDYEDKPNEWGKMLNRLGQDFPWFAVVGNHDVRSWPAYEAIIAAKQNGIGDAQCRGKPGLQANCLFRGVQFIMSGIGTLGDRGEHEAFIERELARSQGPWKLCLWHKTQHDMQTGAKTDEVGWTAYRSCQAAGAIIVTGHEHAYARTKTLTAVGDATVGHGVVGEFNQLTVGFGKTFVAVAGLGGIQTRVFVPSHETDSWWGAYFTLNRESANGRSTVTDNSADGAGALFLDFGSDGNPNKGRGRFVTAGNRRIIDDFSIDFNFPRATSTGP